MRKGGKKAAMEKQIIISTVKLEIKIKRYLVSDYLIVDSELRPFKCFNKTIINDYNKFRLECVE